VKFFNRLGRPVGICCRPTTLPAISPRWCSRSP